MKKENSIWTTPQVYVYRQNIGENGRDHGEEPFIFSMGKKLLELQTPKTFLREKIKDIDVSEYEFFRASADRDVIGSAIVGGLVAGGAGAIVGGMCAGAKAWYIEIDGDIYRLPNEASKKKLEKYLEKRSKK